MTSTVTGIVAKPQALDKVLAALAEIRSSSPTTHTAILASRQILKGLEERPITRTLTEAVADRVVGLDEHGFNPEQVLRAADCASGHRQVLLIPYSKDQNDLSGQLSRAGRRLGMFVVGFFKSLHDEGFGLTSRLGSLKPGPIGPWVSRAKAPVRRIRSLAQPAAPHGPRTSDFDLFLAFNGDHARLLTSRGIPGSKTVVAGYPLESKAWIDLVRSLTKQAADSPKERVRLAFFPRGETPGRPPSKNVVPHQDLSRYISWIGSALEHFAATTEQSFFVTVKPHPIQSVDTLQHLLNENLSSPFKISQEIPSVVVAGSDLAVGTYSSTLVDAILFEVPAIEILVENDWFRTKHPMGSPFLAMGARRASCVVEVEELLGEALNARETFSEPRLDIRANLVEALRKGGALG